VELRQVWERHLEKPPKSWCAENRLAQVPLVRNLEAHSPAFSASQAALEWQSRSAL
jgi:hypothetical protein